MEDKIKNNFIFIGNGGDYFKIWIVNMLLSVITLGIYSAWAKVRNNQYIYSSTILNGEPFEYTANPVRILIGRLIVVSLFATFYICGEVLGLRVVAGFIFIAYILLIPFFVRQAIAFKTRYTRYRGVHFNHLATIWQYYKFFILYAILLVVTVGLIYPYAQKQFKSLVINNTYYGDKRFSFDAKVSSFYVVYLKFVAFLVCVFMVGFIALTLLGGFKTLFFIVAIVYYLVFLFISPFSKGLIDAWIGNIANNNTTLNDFAFQSDWSAWKLGKIYAFNVFMILISFGLLTPWARVQVVSYKFKHLYLIGDNFDSFINIIQDEKRALGEEVADFFDFDIGF